MNTEHLFTRFITSKRALGVTDATVHWYRAHVRAFDLWLAPQAEQPLTPDLMEAYLVYLRDRHKQPGPDGTKPAPLAESSIASAYRALRAFFRWCAEKGLIETSPLAGVKIKRPEAPEPRRALRSEVDALIRSIPVDGWIGLRDYLIVHVIFFCGLRVGELVRLEERHFDLSDPASPVLHIPGGKTGAGVVPLLRDVVEAFMAYQIHRPIDVTDRLLVSAGAYHQAVGALTEAGVRQAIARRCKEAGIRHLNPHSFRHGIAMHLLNDKRVDASLVQRILRHTNIRTTTAFYARWTLGALADEYRLTMGDEEGGVC
jgi:integrase/recombinase XerC